MGLCKNAVNLGFCPVSNGLARRNRDNTSPEQEKKCNYDESKTDGNIQKPWEREHSIAVYPHLQMELYRLIPACVLRLVTEHG